MIARLFSVSLSAVALCVLLLCQLPCVLSGPSFYSRSQYLADRATLLNGLNNGDTFSWNGGTPGQFSVFSSSVIPLVQSTNGQVTAPTTIPQYSALALQIENAGKVCLWGHNTMATPSSTFLNSNIGSATLLSNCLQWLVANSSTVSTRGNNLPFPRVLIHTGSSSVPTTEQKTLFTRNNFTVSNSMNIFATPSPLNSSIDVLVIQDTHFDSVLKFPERLTQVRNFLLNGGSLWLTANSWVFTDYGPGPLNLNAVNSLLTPYGAMVADGAYFSTSNIYLNAQSLPENNNAWWALNAIDNSTGNFNATSSQLYINILSNALNQIEAVYPKDTFASGNHPAQFVIDASTNKYNSFCPSDLLTAAKFPLVAGVRDLERFCVSLMHPLRQYFPLNAAHPMVAIATSIFPGQPNTTRSAATFNITVDVKRTRWYSTGLYAWPGSTIRLTMLDYNNRTVIGNPGQISIRIGCHTDNLFSLTSWSRWPVISVSKNVAANITDITTHAGGLIYLDFSTPLPNKVFSVTFQGDIVEAPFFKAGVTSVADWLSTIRYRRTPYGEIEAEDVILAQPSDVIQTVNDPTVLVTFWDRVVLLARELAQINRKDYKERYTSDIQISLGFMHSGYPIMNYLVSKSDVLTVKSDASTGIISNYNQWGIFHELGHNHQSGYWTFAGTTEVTVNFFSTYLEQRFPDGQHVFGDRDFGPRGSFRADANTYMSNPSFANLQNDPFTFLVFFLDFQTAFGWPAFRTLFKLYTTLPSNELPVTDNDERDQWLTRLSTLVGRNLYPHFQRYAIPVTAQAIANVSSLPAWNISQVLDCSTVRLPFAPCFQAATNSMNNNLYFNITTWLPVRVNESIEIRFYPFLFSTGNVSNISTYTSSIISSSRLLNPSILSWNTDYQQNPSAPFLANAVSWTRNASAGYDAVRVQVTKFIDAETNLRFTIAFPANSTSAAPAFQTSSINRMSLSILSSSNIIVTSALRDTEDRILEAIVGPDSSTGGNSGSASGGSATDGSSSTGSSNSTSSRLPSGAMAISPCMISMIFLIILSLTVMM